MTAEQLDAIAEAFSDLLALDSGVNCSREDISACLAELVDGADARGTTAPDENSS